MLGQKYLLCIKIAQKIINVEELSKRKECNSKKCNVQSSERVRKLSKNLKCREMSREKIYCVKKNLELRETARKK